MYNSNTEQTIRQIPKVGTIDTERLPQELTRIFAEIVDLRNALANGVLEPSDYLKERIILLHTLAANLETLVLITSKEQRSAAFVSGTAHYLLLQISQAISPRSPKYQFEYDSIPEIASAIVLFLIGNSPADAAEVAKVMIPNLNTLGLPLSSVQLMTSIGYLAVGALKQMLDIPVVEQAFENEDDEAVDYLWSLLLNGIKQMASILLGVSIEQRNYFEEVLNLAVSEEDFPFGKESSVFAGPYHLAKLFSRLQADLLSRGVVNIPAPTNVNGAEWFEVLKIIAKDRPYLWENHFEAVQTNFLELGYSAVLTFPTGAGKSTLAELKIASSLLAGKPIIYLVPTHALEEQVSRNLNSLFEQLPPNLSFELEIDIEYTELGQSELPLISVMTPERCLTKLSIDPHAFDSVGLIVFDEFHIISNKKDKLEKRSVESMFCLLSLFTEVSHADYVLISAMVENGQEIANWISEVLERPCISFDSNWKPTRQLQGCLVYDEDEIRNLENFIAKSAKTKTTRTWPKKITDQLFASPYNFFSLQNTWDSKASRDYYISKFLDDPVLLKVNEHNYITSNRNQIAAEFAIQYVNLGFKTLVFVDNPVFAKSTAIRISQNIDLPELPLEDFLKGHSLLKDRLSIELGNIKHSFVNLSPSVAVHHGNLLAMERRLNELYFKHKNGIKVLVATATLAQGINLPAEVVIMAGDDRYDEQSGKMEKFEPHEILNTAGRAGRAGSAAQGIVLLIPGVPITIKNYKLSDRWWQLRNTVFSKGDQCLKINDPMEYFLDKIQVESHILDEEEKNIIFRLQREVESDKSTINFFNKTFAAYRAANANQQEAFESKIKQLIERKREIKEELETPNWVDIVSMKMAVEPLIIISLGEDIEQAGKEKLIKFSVIEIIEWFVDWVGNNQNRISTLFPGAAIQDNILSILGFTGKQKVFGNLVADFKKIIPFIKAYVTGATYEEIERIITGEVELYVPQARKFILKVIPALSHAFGVFGLTMHEKLLSEGYSPDDIPFELKVISSCIREGVDYGYKLQYKYDRPYLPRVQVHEDMDS